MQGQGEMIAFSGRRLQGLRAIVSAAGQGIGRDVALRYVSEGAHVTAVDVNAAALETLRGECGCDIVQLDLTDSSAIRAFARGVGVVDILANLAGIVHGGTILDCDLEEWSLAFRLNVDAMFHMCRALLPGMVDRRTGCIINMSSVASSIKGVPNRFAYSTTKAAVIGFTKALAADYAPLGVRCNAVCPGTIDTPSLQDRLRSSGDYEAARTAFVARQPMGRLGTSQEVAALCAFLASNEAAFVTGQNLVVDGGWSN